MGAQSIRKIIDFKFGSPADEALQAELTGGLESGFVIRVRDLGFPFSAAELGLLDPRILANSKNVSYNPATRTVGGTSCTGSEMEVLRGLLARYSEAAHALVRNLFLGYGAKLKVMRTSLRPAEIAGRKSSWRKDDTRLHVDAFPSQPTQGSRILRVFRNVNQAGQPRVWRLGEPFEDAARHFLPRVGRPFPGSARLLNLLGLTKKVRSEYDFIMLKLHDAMKADDGYQQSTGIEPVLFQPGETWICYADSVSHAAISGQHQFEQTLLIPLEAMKNPEKSPLRILEKMRARTLA
jgi:hypothetical protein